MDFPPSPRKILILDDNRIDRETCRRFLSRESSATWTFLEKDSIEGALELTFREKPDCILLDYHLHDGTGLEFLRELKAAGGTKTHPVVMLTGTGSEWIAVEVMKEGAQDYLVKDRLDAENLRRTVDGAIQRAHMERLIEGQQREMEILFREAKEANARKDHFLATLSHELRTPLSPVLAAVSLLEDGITSAEELAEIAAIIRRNIELEARLIDDMLDLTRISRGILEVETRPVDIRNVLHSASQTCEVDLRQKRMHLDWEFGASSHRVLADEARLQQVFWNLLKNAAKFTPEGGHIVVSTRNLPDGLLEIRVKDNGIGIEPGSLERIFMSFEQASPATAKRFGGMGLGLAISRALLDAHGGSIHAESDPASPGAVFVVRLPVEKEAAPSEDPVEVEKKSEPAPSSSLVVLLVEDHEDSRFFFTRIIERLGHKVIVAKNGREARELFAGNPVDFIISDIGLPDEPGTALVAGLLAIRKVPAIALSGYGMPEDIQRSQEAGFSRHLTKPVAARKLVSTFNELQVDSAGHAATGES